MIRKFIVNLVLGLASLAGLSQFLWTPVIAYSQGTTGTAPSLFEIILELLKPVSAIYPYFGGGYLFILAVLFLTLWLFGTVRSVLNYIDRSTCGLSVLETRLSLDIQDANGTLARSRRQQRFHANEPNISASKLTHVADAEGGEVLKDTIKVRSWLGPREVTREVLPRGSGRQTVVTEQYERPLPVNWLVLYLPNVIVFHANKHFNLFSGAVVNRASEVTYKNEFRSKDCVVSLFSPDRPITNTEIVVSFHPEYWKDVSDIKAYLVRETALEHVQVEELPGNGHPTLRVRTNYLREAKLEVHWRFRAPFNPCERCPITEADKKAKKGKKTATAEPAE